jgi:hypothetical protein
VTPPPICLEHPVSEVSIYGAERRKYCRACRREKEHKTHRHQPRCGRGHLKTPWTWRRYKSGFRCLRCQSVRDAERRKNV